MTSEVFESFFSNPHSLPAEVISIDAYQCFVQFFLAVNSNEKLVDIRGNLFLSRNQTYLIGFNTLMEIVLKAKEVVAVQAIYFVVNLTMRLGRGLKSKKVDIWSAFLDQALGYIENSGCDDDLIIERVLKLLLCFLDDNGQKEDSKSGSSILYYVKTMHESEYKKVNAFSSQNMGSLRRKIADLYKKPINTVVLTIGSIRYDSYDDDMPLTNIKSSVVNIDFIQPKVDEINQIEILAKHQKLVDILFHLLSQPDKAHAGLA